jgi:hypothetical protein
LRGDTDVKRIVAVFVGLFLPVISFAWDEPTSFMGVPFGKNIEESLPKCPYNWSEVAREIYGQLCWTQNYYKTIYLLGGVNIAGAFPMVASARQIDNKLEYIGLSFRSNFFAKVYAILEERYGKPTELAHPTWMSRGGLKIQNDVARWTGRDMIILARKSDDSVNNSVIEYATKVFRDSQDAKQQKAIKDAAKGL